MGQVLITCSTSPPSTTSPLRPRSSSSTPSPPGSRSSPPFAAPSGWDRLRTFALLLSLSGILIIIGAPGTGELDPTGATLSLSAAFLYALYIPLLRRLQRGTTPTTAVFWIAVGVCVILLAYGAARDELTLAVTARSLGALLWLAIIPTLLAFRLFLRGLETLGPGTHRHHLTAEPFCAAILAALVLGERMTPVCHGRVAS